MGRGVRIRELDRVFVRYAPWRSLSQGIRVAIASGRPGFVPFKLIYDSGVLFGFASSLIAPNRHWR
jgi:hypothetical protein